MRTLVYKVKDQRIIRSGDHGGLVAGTKGYLIAKFDFDENWDDCVKVASFFTNDQKEQSCLLDKNDTCKIPEDVLKHNVFKLRVEGRREGYRILTDRAIEQQSGGEN